MDEKALSVLLVEDNPADARLIEEILGEAADVSFDLEYAGRLSKGIEHLASGDVDVILLDLSLPDSKGLDTFTRVHMEAPQVPIVVLSGVDDEALAIQAVREGAQDYLVKGMAHMDILARSIRYAVERKHGEEELRKAHDELELRVRDRTVELAEANQELQVEIVERKRVEEKLRRRAALDRVRSAGLLMEAPNDIQNVLAELHRQLRDIGLEFEDCSVQIVDEGRKRFECHYLGAGRMPPVLQVPLADSVVYEAWRNKRPIHRRNLEEEDRYDELGLIRRASNRPIRSVVDVPFSQGTIAVNSARPDAFSEADIETLVQFARVLSETYTRFEDIQRIEESEKRYRAIFEQAADSVVLIDAETGALVEFNDTAHRNLGYTREEFETLRISDFEVIESGEEVAKHIEKILREGTDTFETKHRTKAGELRDIQVSARAISIGGRDLVQSIWRDVTDQKRVEKELREQENRLARIETLKQALVTLSHHINNAMTAIVGNAQLCRRGTASADQLIQVCLFQTKRISAVLGALDKMVKQMDIRTVSYIGLQDAMFDIEEELRRTLEEG